MTDIIQLEECDSCGASDVPGIKKVRDCGARRGEEYQHCLVCYGTHAGSTHLYPSGIDTRVTATMAGCTNMVLKAIAQLAEAVGVDGADMRDQFSELAQLPARGETGAMKLWLLRPIHVEEGKSSAWRPRPYDKAYGFVVRAETELEAREEIATSSGKHTRGDEGGKPWLDAGQSTCVELTSDGIPGVIIRDFKHG